MGTLPPLDLVRQSHLSPDKGRERQGWRDGLAERLHYRAHLAPSHLTKVDGPSTLAGAARLMLGRVGGVRVGNKSGRQAAG